MSNPVNAEITLSHFFPRIEPGSAKRADHGTGSAADAQVFVHMDHTIIGIPEDGPFGTYIHARSITTVETGQGDEVKLCRGVFAGFYLGDLPERGPIGWKVILIHAGHDTGHASSTARQIKRKTKLHMSNPLSFSDFSNFTKQ
jgi:hypothetical protein